jgi:hypothetical protein
LATRIRDLNIDFGDKLREHAEEDEHQQEDEQKETDRSTAARSPAPEDCEPTGRPSEEAAVSISGTHAVDDDLGVPHSLHLLHRDPPLQPLQVFVPVPQGVGSSPAAVSSTLFVLGWSVTAPCKQQQHSPVDAVNDRPVPVRCSA